MLQLHAACARAPIIGARRDVAAAAPLASVGFRRRNRWSEVRGAPQTDRSLGRYAEA